MFIERALILLRSHASNNGRKDEAIPRQKVRGVERR